MDTLENLIVTTNVWSTYTDAVTDWDLLIDPDLNNSIGNFNPDQTDDLVPGGPRRDTLYVVVPITIIYISIFFTGTIGNISTCIVIARNKSMHTATNYYLFSLAISDLLLLVSGLPAEVWLIWFKYPYVFGECFCVLRGLAAETSTNATVLTITAFTVERYVAICHPFLSQTMSKLSRAIKLILAIWLVALSFAIPQAWQFGLVQIYGPESVMCAIKEVIIRHSFELSTFLFFVVPMTLITILYALIGLKLRKSNTMKRDRGRGENSRVIAGSIRKERHKNSTGRSSRRVLKMLVAVVVAFFICWAPFHVQRLIAIYGTNSEDHVSSKGPMEEFLYLLFTYLSGVLYYVSTTINPILYNIMSHKFREAFMETLSRGCRFRRFAVKREQRSYSSLSRSQQRTPGMFSSKTVGTTGGMGIAQESTEYSGNSFREESPRRLPSFSTKNGKESLPGEQSFPSRKPSSKSIITLEIGTSDIMQVSSSKKTQETLSSNNLENQRWQKNILVREKMLEKESPSKSPRCIAVKVPNGGSTKKWWKLLDWLPGFKSFRVQRRLAYGAAEIRDTIVIENNPLDEYSMNLCSFRENENNRRPL